MAVGNVFKTSATRNNVSPNESSFGPARVLKLEMRVNEVLHEVVDVGLGNRIQFWNLKKKLPMQRLEVRLEGVEGFKWALWL